MRGRSPILRAWRPAKTQSGQIVLFHGWIDNAAELADKIAAPPNDLAAFYGAAVERWGDEADQRLIGWYCAVIDDRESGLSRLSRSALQGPPLHYFEQDGTIGVASVPRVLETMGLRRELNTERLAESLFFLHDSDAGYLKGARRVPYGTIVKLARGRRELVTFHDPLAIQPLPPAPVEEYVREVDRLLSEGVARIHAGARRPGLLLTGGLDSSNVAARLVGGLSAERQVPTFTYVPLPDHGVPDLPGCLLDEGPAVLEFCRQFPQLQPHLVRNEGIGFDHRLDDMLLAMGTGSVNSAILFRYHGLYAAAREQGCDMLLSSDLGNLSFSSEGNWAFSEYLVTRRWRQLWMAVKGYDRHPGSLFWRFCSRSVVPLLPDPLWRLAMKLRGADPAAANDQISGLRGEVIARFDLRRRARAAGTHFERNWPASRRQILLDNFGRGDVDGADMIQGFEQLYEVSMRDATAYRPLVDFCIGLPTDVFMRDGVSRWLARELGKGLMPEPQRQMRGHGQHNTDWYLRYTPKLPEMREAVAEIRRNPMLNDLLDADRLEADLDNWPKQPTYNDEAMLAATMRLPRSLAMVRYVKLMQGGNAS